MMSIIAAIHVTKELKARKQVMRQLKVRDISRQLSAEFIVNWEHVMKEHESTWQVNWKQMKSELIARDKSIKSTLHKLWPRSKWTLNTC